MDRVPITAWQQLRDRIGSILERINSDPALTLAAASNPLYALEELGFDIDPRVQAEFEERLRFKPGTLKRIHALREEIFRHAGAPFDLHSQDALSRVLFTQLHIGAPSTPLESLAGAHPIVAPLLEYRRLDATVPKLAPRELYDEIRRGKRRLGVHRIHARLKSAPP